MDPVDVFSVRDLRQRSGDLLKDAENGHIAVITKHGRPAILAVPFDARLLDLGVHRALALHLFENRHLTMAQADLLEDEEAEEAPAEAQDETTESQPVVEPASAAADPNAGAGQ